MDLFWNGRDFRQAVWMTFGLWLLILAAYALSELIAGRHAFLAQLPIDVVAVLLVAALVLPAYPLILRLGRRTTAERWATLAAAVVLISFAQSVVNLVENRILGVVPAIDVAHLALIRDRFSRNFQSHLYVTFANVALIAFIVEVRRSAERSVALAQGAAALAEARAATDRERLAALRLQLNPHFLFNTLNSISSLVIVGRNGDADRMIEKLSDFLRSTLDVGEDLFVTLNDELATLDAYLDIQTVRFGERLQVAIEVDTTLGERLHLPSFILQPLVENAIKYAVAPASNPVCVTVSAGSDGCDAWIAVTDDGDAGGPSATKSSGMGVGLANTRDRLRMHYGERARLETGRRPEGGWVSRIVMPHAPERPVRRIS